MLRPTRPRNLVQLAQAKLVSVIDEHRIRRAELSIPDSMIVVQTENVDLVMVERDHDLFEFVFFHLPVADANARTRNNLAKFVRKIVDTLNSVVEEENLTTTLDFSFNRFTNCFFVVHS